MGESIRLPSQSSTLLATHPMVRSAASVSIAAATQRGPGRASLLRSATYSPVACATPRLHPREAGVGTGLNDHGARNRGTDPRGAAIS